MNGYKVCRVVDGKILSALNLGYVTEYKIGEIVSPREEDGPFAVFTNYFDAERFRDTEDNANYSDRKIFACEFEPDREYKVLWFVDTFGYKAIWEEDLLPTGTVFAKSVKLSEEVNENVEENNT